MVKNHCGGIDQPGRSEVDHLILKLAAGEGKLNHCPHCGAKFNLEPIKCPPCRPILPGVKQEAVSPFFATLRAANPLPTTRLQYTSVFEFLAAVRRSAQATGVGVNKATRRLYAVASTPKPILRR